MLPKLQYMLYFERFSHVFSVTYSRYLCTVVTRRVVEPADFLKLLFRIVINIKFLSLKIGAPTRKEGGFGSATLVPVVT